MTGGRGAPTDSMSCSDKIAVWLKSGLTGGLLESVFESIFIDEIIIGPCRPDTHHIERSLFRFEPDVKPEVIKDKNDFIYAESKVTEIAKSKVVPASACAVWYEGLNRFEQLDGKTGKGLRFSLHFKNYLHR